MARHSVPLATTQAPVVNYGMLRGRFSLPEARPLAASAVRMDEAAATYGEKMEVE